MIDVLAENHKLQKRIEELESELAVSRMSERSANERSNSFAGKMVNLQAHLNKVESQNKELRPVLNMAIEIKKFFSENAKITN